MVRTARKLPIEPDAPATPDAPPAADAEELPPAKVILERLRELRRIGEAAGEPIPFENMANGVGVHNGTLSRALAGKQKPSEQFCRKAWTYIRLMEMRAEDPHVDGRIVETSVTRRVRKLCRYCQVERCIGMLVSETSCGKTEALRAYARSNPSAIYVHATARTDSIAGMVDGIWRASKAFRDPGGSSRHRGKRVREKWDDIVRGFTTSIVSARVILIDDAHVLNFRVLEALREIHDETNLGIVLAGTTRLQARVTASGDAHQMYEQIRARVMVIRVIRKPSPTDVAAVAAAWAPPTARFTPRAMQYLQTLSQGLGALRVVKAHVRMALRLGGKHKIDADREAIDERHLLLAHTHLEDRASSLA